MNDQEIKHKYVTLYHAEWCGHCKTFKPIWDDFKKTYEASKDDIKNKYKIVLTINDYEETANPEEITKANVNGFPTVVIKYNDKTEDYTGQRTITALFQKLIPNASPDDIKLWINKANTQNTQKPTYTQIGGIKILQSNDPKIVYVNSYRKLQKYYKKCQELNLV